MEANELRIGNYVGYGINFDKSQSITTIKGIKEGKVLLDTDFICLLEQIKPILITEELLLKCGFERIFENSNLFLNITNDIYFYWYNDKLNGCVRNHYMDSDNQLSELTFNLEILYLNQLQNIFFALTNQELKINL